MGIEKVEAWKDSSGKLYASEKEAICGCHYEELIQLVCDCTYDDYFHLDDLIANLKNSPDKARRMVEFFQGLIKED